MADPIVELENVTKRYVQGSVEVMALRGLDLRIETGEFATLVGPSGSGKSTALNLIGALDRPTSGVVRVEGRDLAKLSARELSRMRRDRIGFVFQAYNLIPVLTARENVEFVMELQGVKPAERHARADELLAEVGLGDLGEKRPLEMSGGQQQRVAVARAIVGRPKMVLADEPTANLDSATAHRLLELMGRLNVDRGITFLFSTHDPAVMEAARRLVRLHDGRIVSDEPTAAA